MRPGGGHSKGAEFERTICRQLSLWWTEGKRDDIFWRTPQSGGRATNRKKKGKETFGHYGDILATHPFGLPLLTFMTFELKCGYGMASSMDLVDGGEKTLWFKWIMGIRHVQHDAKSDYWGLIVKRHSKTPIICFPSDLRITKSVFRESFNHQTIYRPEFGQVDIVRLEDFLSAVWPRSICQEEPSID